MKRVLNPDLEYHVHVIWQIVMWKSLELLALIVFSDKSTVLLELIISYSHYLFIITSHRPILIFSNEKGIYQIV